MRRHPRLSMALGLCLAVASPAGAESKHVFGIAFWDWGANIDVMSHRTGWVIEQSALIGGGGPNISGRYEPAVAEGFTVIQRLDWGSNLDDIMAVSEADQNTFAQRCGSWANALKRYCRVYTIGNEMEFVTGMSPAVYASGFTKVRNAIKAVQPDAKVIIGHWMDGEHVRAVIRLVGVNGYDGVTDHTGSSVPEGFLDMLDEEGARPEVGVYISEWGWVADTNPNAMNVMRSFYQAIGASNASRARQVYCACWYLYPGFLGKTFSLELATTYDNPAFEAATALGTSFNSYGNNPILMSNLYADVPDNGASLTISWNTNVAARRQLWSTSPPGAHGWQYEHFTLLDDVLGTNHQIVMTSLSPGTAYEVTPTSTKDDYGDAGGRRFKVTTGPWTSQVTQTGPGRVVVHWATEWPMNSRVEYGPTASLGQLAQSGQLATTHDLTLGGLPLGTTYYRVLSSENNPDGTAPLYVRSPIRSFVVISMYPGDFDGDTDTDQEDFGRFQSCYTGPGIPQLDPACLPARMDMDDDVDLSDLALFRVCMSGANVPTDANCLNP